MPDAATPPQIAAAAQSITSQLLRWSPWLIGAAVLAGGAGLGASYLVTPVFTARTTFLPPQAQQSGAASALASLGSIAGLPSAGSASRGTPEQYLAFLQSVTITDRIVDGFGLMKLYDTPFKASARRALLGNVRIAAGRKDGLITLEVDDTQPQRAAEIANRFVDELRQLTTSLALTEAQQRRSFFDRQLQQTKDSLTKAQLALQSSGVSANSLKTEPKATAEAYVRLKSEMASAEMRAQQLRTTMTPNAIELQQAESLLSGLRAQVARVEAGSQSPAASSSEYVGKYREYKYQETLFELYARQFELARADEAREGPLIQVVDKASTPELKSRPKRLNFAFAGAAAGICLALLVQLALLRRRRPK